MAILLSACMPQIVTPHPPTQNPALWVDESAVVSGICFEAAFDAAGQIFIVRDAEEHIHFYDLADNSRLCRHPVTRLPFDFNGERVLAGLWSKGIGCSAHHNLTQFERDDSARRVVIQLEFITEGDCNYELIRPFWLGIPNAAEYEIEFVVS